MTTSAYQRERGRLAEAQVMVVMLEGALRARVVSAPTLAGQLDRLMAVSGLASLELCIIPFEAAVPVFPLSGFRLYDDLVIVESIVGEQQLAGRMMLRFSRSCRRQRRAGDGGGTARPSGSSAPPSSNSTTPLHSRLHPCPGWLATALAALRSDARASRHRGRCRHSCLPAWRAGGGFIF